MAKAIWGMDFGNWSLKVVRASYDRKSDAITVDVVDEFVYGDLPCGYEASPLEKHREGIIAFQSKYQIAAGDDLCVGVTGSEVFSRFINLPPVAESLDQIIRYEARQQIPFDINDVVWDYQRVKEEEEGPGEEIEVGLFALKKERVEELLDLLAPWRLNLRVIQNAPLAVYNFLSYEQRVGEACIVLDVGGATADVLVLNPPRFWIRTLLVAGNDLTNALVQKLGVTPDEAEMIKARAGRSAHREQILRTLEPVFDEITNEVQRSLGYYKSLVRDVKFEQILALGNAIRLEGMQQMLGAGLQYKVEPLRELHNIEVADSVDKEKMAASLPGLCAALGLVVQGAGLGRVTINMVPEDIAMVAEISRKKPWILTAAAGVVLIALLLIAAEHLYARDLSRVDSAVPWGIVEQADTVQKQYSAALAQANSMKSQIQALTGPLSERALYLDLLGVVSASLPPDIYLSKLDFKWAPAGTKPGASTTPAGFGGGMGPGGFTGGMGPGGFGGLGPGGPGMPPSYGGVPAMGAAGRATATTPGFPQSTTPVNGPNSELQMVFSAETTEIHQGEEHIQKLIEDLSKAEYPASKSKVFRTVELTGKVRDIWRNAATGEQVEAPAAGSLEGSGLVLHFLAFDGYGVVNTSISPAQGQ